jgi:hypothetical protein
MVNFDSAAEEMALNKWVMNQNERCTSEFILPLPIEHTGI